MQRITATIMVHFPTLYIHLVAMMSPLLLLLLDQNERVTQCTISRKKRRRECTRIVLQRDVPTGKFKEECAVGTVPKS